jgi:hypothetical protein
MSLGQTNVECKKFAKFGEIVKKVNAAKTIADKTRQDRIHQRRRERVEQEKLSSKFQMISDLITKQQSVQKQ